MGVEETKDRVQQNYEALLMDYAAGVLDEAQSLIVAAHLTLSPRARQMVRECEAIGGALINECCSPIAMMENSLQAVLSKLDQPYAEEETPCHVEEEGYPEGLQLPKPVCRYVQVKRQKLVWRRVYPGIQASDIRTRCGRSKARLMKVAPGVQTPEHSHRGIEITLMIDGASHDDQRTYRRGDMVVMDENFTHKPVADLKEGCVCLMVTSGPMRLTGPLAQLLNPFLRK